MQRPPSHRYKRGGLEAKAFTSTAESASRGKSAAGIPSSAAVVTPEDDRYDYYHSSDDIRSSVSSSNYILKKTDYSPYLEIGKQLQV